MWKSATPELDLQKSLLFFFFFTVQHDCECSLCVYIIYTVHVFRTDHQWNAPKESVKTGGPNWQKQNLQSATIPPVQQSKAANWSSGMQAGHFPVNPMQSQPMMVGQPMMMGAQQPMMMGRGQPMMMQQPMGMQTQPFGVSY